MSDRRWKTTLAYYTKTHKKAPGTAQGLDWSERSQQQRFDILLEGIRERAAADTVLDVGCGYGDLSRRLDWAARYRGIDLNPLMIATARERYPALDFRVANLEDEHGHYDWVVSSGAFNIKVRNSESLLADSIKNMWRLARKGVLFNVLAAGSEVTNPAMKFFDPSEVLAQCRALTPYVVCRLDYLPHDASYYLYRKQAA
jgi:SAM-dependent methyltransferase